MKQAYLECGQIVTTHGCRGGIKVESYCDSPSVLAGLKTVFMLKEGEYVSFKVRRASVFKQFVLFELEGISDMDAAMALKGTILYAEREAFHLKKGDYFIADLIGLPVKNVSDGTIIGVLTDVINRGASDIYVVKTETGEGMIPAVPEFIKKTDLDDAIYVAPIEGMFD